ncbi:MAG TPA: hypothetical protein VHR66_28545 [Gemmataceae bacterium]|jgi:hypothetical protein|nr:hypothetical protein [Gemmataceae bacterium]
MGRTLVYVLVSVILLSGIGICAFLILAKPAWQEEEPPLFEAKGTACDLSERVPVLLNRGPEIKDGFRGDVHPMLRSPGEMKVAAAWKFDKSQETDTAFPLAPRKLQEILLNLAVAVPTKTYTARDFSAFLPAEEPQEVGQTWALDSDKLIDFLKQFHPAPSMHLLARGRRAGPDGAFATLRAISPTHIDIVFRVHAEYDVMPAQYKDRLPMPGAWYSPSSFLGRLVIDREAGAVEYFRLALPNDDRHNVHCTLSNGFDEGEVHGWMRIERMELVAGNKARVDGLTWTNEMAATDAQSRLTKIFYRFKDIDWVPFEKAEEIARQKKKPIFVVVAMGSLDNQTC